MADERPQYQFGTGTIGDQSFHWGSGEPGKYWSIPYGDYPVTPDAPKGAWAQGAGAIPIANNVIPDPQLGRNRIGIMIHSGSSASLDQLYTQGCFKVAPQEWPAVRSEILKEAGNGPLYLHVQPGGVAAFTNTPTYSQASGQTPAANANAVANTTASPTPTGTTVNSQNAPVKGALAETGPESAGSNRAYTFALPQNAPMGMGNNNPLNIKYYKGAEKDYPGLTGPSSNTDQGDPQMKFGSPEAGWNAAYSLLNKKYTGGMTTPNIIIAGKGGWTPGNTQAAANVAKSAGIGPDDDIGFSNPDKAKAFMRALVTQEQGAAAKAYPDEMIAASIGGNAPASGAAPAAVAAAPAADTPWWQKAFQPPTDAQGNPVAGGKSPFQQAASALGGDGKDKGSSLQQFKEAQEEEAPQGQVKNQAGPSPGARNTSPMGGMLLPSVPQTYGQTLNSLSAPLTWNSAPPGAPKTAPAGLQGSPAAQIPGMTLNTYQDPRGIGYGVDPNIGYGFS